MAEIEFRPTNPPLNRPSKMLLSLFASRRAIALGYMVFLILAEVLTTLIEPGVGLVAHGLLLLMLFLHASLWGNSELRGFLLSLSIAPLIRLLSLSLPLPSFPFIYWYMVVGAPLLIAAYVASQVGQINRRMLGLTMHNLPVQLLIATSGMILGYLEYQILRPDPLIAELRLELLWVPALILLIFTGFLEEWVFRGLMQYTAMRSFGRFGFYYVAAVFAVLHIGYNSVLDVVFVFIVALFFGWVARRTGSILGVTLAHGLTNISLFLVFPFIAIGNLPLPSLMPIQNPLVETQSAPTPVHGLLAPINPMEATRPWVPPTSTARPVQITKTLAEWTVTVTIEPPLTTPTNTVFSHEATPTCTPHHDWKPYVVQTGDTLSLIALKTGVSVEQLLQANCFTTSMIYSGQVLYIPPIQVQRPNITRTVIASETPGLLPTETPELPRTTKPTKTQTEMATEIPKDTSTSAPTETPTLTDIPLP